MRGHSDKIRKRERKQFNQEYKGQGRDLRPLWSTCKGANCSVFGIFRGETRQSRIRDQRAWETLTSQHDESSDATEHYFQIGILKAIPTSHANPAWEVNYHMQGYMQSVSPQREFVGHLQEAHTSIMISHGRIQFSMQCLYPSTLARVAHEVAKLNKVFFRDSRIPAQHEKSEASTHQCPNTSHIKLRNPARSATVTASSSPACAKTREAKKPDSQIPKD